MDLRPEIIHNSLSQVGLPSTLEDLQNPTKEYVLNLIKQFLNRCHIDYATIIKPTLDQSNSLTLVEFDPEMVSLINLSEAMSGICSDIFMKDFCLTDLTSPTPKKTCKLAKVLSNFLLYADTKREKIEEAIAERRFKQERLDNIKKEINKCRELKNQKAVEIAKKITLKEQYTAEIASLQSLREPRKAQISEAQGKLEVLEKEKLEVLKKHGELVSEAIEMRTMTEELESKLVRSPEQYEARFKELIEQKKHQIEQRHVIEAAMQSKNPAIAKLQSHLSIVSNLHSKIPEITETYERLQKSKKILEEAKKKVAQMNAMIKDETALSAEENSQAVDRILQRTKDECDEHLASIRYELSELLNEKKRVECKLADAQTRQQEIYTQRDEISVTIKKVIDEIEELVAYGQETYDKEIDRLRKEKEMLEKEH
ncbi:cingulin-like [Venturia canescens]|uniref:cingulin-like n=1 Tax=Venturia canescens TaxID=32260 RepID=UPI001C9D3C1C|nr:cingulin-like [Venturia canescens]XP_043274326.1 cingulin-like [Venturia canescens]